MNTFISFVIPISYFRATRLNKWSLVGYNALVEWIPAVVISLYFNQWDSQVLTIVALSYLAFISIYEIGYITNDYFSERYEADPRGRSVLLDGMRYVAFALVLLRVSYFFSITYWLGQFSNPIWIGFFAALAVTFTLHNLLPSSHRVSTFFGLATFRFLAPIVLVVEPSVMAYMLPAILINNSLYRTSVYMRNKIVSVEDQRRDATSKLAFYIGVIPISAFCSVYFQTYIPLVICTYFLLVWTFYFSVSRKKES